MDRRSGRGGGRVPQWPAMGGPLMMPMWFSHLVGQIESLSLDSRADRERLWEVVADNIPAEMMRAAIYAYLAEWLVRVGGMPRDDMREVIEPLADAVRDAALAGLVA